MTFRTLPLAAQIAAMEARAKREREVYGQTELPDMLMAGVEAMKRVGEVEKERDGFYSDWDAALKLTNKIANLMLKMDADRLEQHARAEAAEARLAAYEEKQNG